MRIGFISDDYYPRVDGVVSYIDTMRLALEKLGHEVFVVCPKYPGYKESTDKVIRVASYDPLPFSKLTSRMVVTNKKTLRTIEELNLDILHSHTQAGANVAAFMAHKRFGVKLINTIHTTYHELINVYPGVAVIASAGGNFLAWRYYHDTRALRSIFRLPIPLHKAIAAWTDTYIRSVMDYSDLVLTNSAHTKKYVQSFNSTTAIKIAPNGVDRKLFHAAKVRPNNKVFRLAYTGRISGEKHQEQVIKAIKELKDSGVECELVLIGDGPDRHKCTKLIDMFGLDGDVTITGEIPPHEVRKELAKSDAGILASKDFDTDPLSVKEYLSMGLPVIYCDKNFDEMFPSGGGIYSKSDTYSLSEAIKTIIKKSPQELDELRNESLESAKIHDIKKQAKLLEKIYLELLKSK